MCAIDIKEASTIRPQVLDELQCGNRPLRDSLTASFECFHDGIGLKVHGNPLPDQENAS